MDYFGGILGQIIATLNAVVIISAHLVVLLHDRKQKRLEKQKAANQKKQQLHQSAYGRKQRISR